MIKFRHFGNFKRTEKLLDNATKINFLNILESYGNEGVLALSSSTPKDTGITADSWGYEVKNGKKGYTISWTNSSENKGIPIVILIQYGHGTGNGAYVQGRDFINPAITPVLDKIAEKLWEEVAKL